MKKTPIAYLWDYDGEYDPAKKPPYYSTTFSVGVFQWLPKASKKGLKKSAVVKRIRGLVSNPQDVYDRAQAECDKRNLVIAQ